MKRTYLMELYWIWYLLLPTLEAQRLDNKNLHKQPRFWHPYALPKRSESFLKERLPLQGRSYAGKMEFPWLVEMRTLDSENTNRQKDWANGNLITGKYVLTTCDAVAYFRIALRKSFYNGNPNYLVVRKDPSLYKLMYSSDYPYKTRRGHEDEVGTRLVRSFLPHPLCKYFILDYQFGIVEAKGEPIFPFPPYTLYMQLDWKADEFQRLKIEYNKPKEYFANIPEPCVIALWSRLIDDGKPTSQTIWNYKVKYEVRWVEPKICQQNLNVFHRRFKDHPITFMECMGISQREKIGVICDHDRGAPIVCNGTVRALMLGGALPQHCNNSQPKPFLVLDLQFIFPIYSHMNSLVWSKLDVERFRQPRAGGPHCCHQENLLLLVLFVACLVPSISE